ncbi:MAG: hypothetical protein P4L50_31070 [Anaerolineaceae bacterium]|nr:hypothetical protein [Anaerolineaceae bacterium]
MKHFLWNHKVTTLTAPPQLFQTFLPITNVEEAVNTIKYSSSSTPAYKCQETYRAYPWGWELKETSISNDTVFLPTEYEYYTDPAYYGYGQLKQVAYPDGFWQKRVYGDYVVQPETPTGTFGGSGSRIGLKIYQPYFDGLDGGAVSPDDANDDNCSVTEYTTMGQIGGPPAIVTLNHRKYISLTAPQLYHVSGIKYTGLNTTYNADGWPDTWTFDCDDASPLGMAGHTFKNHPDALTKIYTYDHGTYDGMSNEISINPTNHLYAADGLNQYFPDHQATEYDLNNVSFSEGTEQQFEPEPSDDWIDDGNYFYNIDGHEVYDIMLPQVTKKKAMIYHRGNMVQWESYVYMGSLSIDPTPSGEDIYPQWAMLTKLRYYYDSLGHATNIVRIDPISSQARTLYSCDYRGNSAYDGELLLSETDEFGRKTSYAYDSLQRIHSSTDHVYGGRPDQVTTFTYDANGQKTSQVTTAGSLTQSQSATFDIAGRVIDQVDQSGIESQIAYGPDNLTTTTTYPGGLTTTQVNYIDRHSKSLTGDAAVSKYYDHRTVGCFGNINGMCFGGEDLDEEFTRLGAEDSPRWKGQAADLHGHSNALTEWPTGGGTANTAWHTYDYFFNSILSESTSAGYPRVYYHGDFYENPTFKATLPYGTGDDLNISRNTWAKSRIIAIGDILFQATTNFVYLTDETDDKTVQSIHLEQLNGFTGTEAARTIDYDADNNDTTTTTTIDRANNKITTTTSQPHTSTLTATNIYQNGLPLSSSTLSVASPTVYKYDALGRTNQIISPLGDSAYINYDPVTSWVTSQTDFTGQTTRYEYYSPTEANAGKLKCQTGPTGKKTYYSYTTRGELHQTWGDVPYPAEYRYNEYGDLTNLITFRNDSGWTGSFWPSVDYSTGDNTYWQYDDASGALLKKTDATNHSVTYTYDPTTGRLLTRSWARLNGGMPVTVTNSYNGFGDLVAQEYSDGTPNVYFNNYNRAGQPRQIVDGSGTTEMTYDHASRLVASYCSAGLLNGITVSNHFDPYKGRDAVAVLNNATEMLEDDYGYDAYGRLGSVSSGGCSATYGYVPNSDLLQSTTFKNGGGNTVLTTTRTWDFGMRLRSIANVVDSTPVTSHSYQYDALNRRTQATLEDGSFWQYGYNDRDELTSANRNWASAPAPVSGQQFSYAYDNIGNRTTAGFGGDATGNPASLRTITYTNNSLNQYIGITTPGFENIIGAALATNTVTVNGGVADCKGEYFHREISISNTNQPVWQNVTNIAGTFTNKGGSLIPAHGQTLTYDADGNLTFDGIWNYEWDGENRLISMNMTNNVLNLAATNQLRLDFTYDYLGRRVQKIVASSTFVMGKNV